jgi:hypothetical protein
VAIRKTISTRPSSSSKKIASSNVSRKMQTEPHQLTSEEREQIGRDLLLLISSATSHASKEQMTEDEVTDPTNSPFLLGASQVNADLASAAQCEFEEDISVDDIDGCFFDIFRSPMYWSLRETFVKEAASGDTYSFMRLVWRVYNAGLLSPDRLLPDSTQRRQERRAKSLERQLSR